MTHESSDIYRGRPYRKCAGLMEGGFSSARRSNGRGYRRFFFVLNVAHASPPGRAPISGGISPYSSCPTSRSEALATSPRPLSILCVMLLCDQASKSSNDEACPIPLRTHAESARIAVLMNVFLMDRRIRAGGPLVTKEGTHSQGIPPHTSAPPQKKKHAGVFYMQIEAGPIRKEAPSGGGHSLPNPGDRP